MKQKTVKLTALLLAVFTLPALSGCSGSSLSDRIKGKWTAEVVLEDETSEPVRYIKIHDTYDFYDETHVTLHSTRDDVDEPYDNEGSYWFDEDMLCMIFTGDCSETMQRCSFTDDGIMVWGENDNAVKFTKAE